MKYHSTPLTILISIIVVLLFVGVSFFILTQLNLTSPTLIATNILFEELGALDSDIGLSFSSIERNLRDGINIHDLELRYKGENLLSFENISLDKGIFSLISYGLTGVGNLGVTAENGSFILPEALLSSNTNEPNSEEFSIEEGISIQIPEILKKYALEIGIENLDIILPYGIVLENCNINGDWNNGIEDSSLSVSIPHFMLEYDKYSASSSNFVLSLYESDGIYAHLSLEDAYASLDAPSLGASRIALHASTPSYNEIKILDIPFSASMEDISFSYNDMLLNVGSISGSFKASGSYAKLKDTAFQFNDYIAKLDGGRLSTDDFNKFALTLDGIDVYEKNNLLLDVPNIETSLLLKEKSVNISSSDILSGNISLYTGDYLSSAEILDLNISVDALDGLHGSLDGSMRIGSSHEIIDNTVFDTSFVFNASKTGLDDFDILIDNLKLPKLDSPILINLSGDDGSIALNFNLDSSIVANIEYDGNINAGLEFNEFNLERLRYAVDEFAPSLSQYITAQTEINGEFNVDFTESKSSKIGFNGPLSCSFDISNANFNGSNFDISSLIESDFQDSGIYIKRMDVETNWVDMLYAGSLSWDKMLPEGNFVLLSSDRSQSYFDIHLFASNYKEYSFFGYTSKLRDTNIYGLVNFATPNHVLSEFQFTLLGNAYPLDLDLNFENRELALYNDSLDLNVNWLDIIDISIDMDKFKLSKETPEFIPSSLSGHIGLSFDFANQLFSLDIPEFEMEDIYRLPGAPDFVLSASGNNEIVEINNMELTADGFPPLIGKGLFDIRGKNIAVSLSDADDVSNENILLSVIKYNGEYNGTIRGSNINLARLGLDQMIGNFNLSGHALKLEDFSFSGTVNANAIDPTNDYRKIYANLYIDNEKFNFTDFIYSNDIIALSVPFFGFDSTKGLLSLEYANGSVTLSQADGPFVIDANLSLNVELPATGSIISSITEVISKKGEGLVFNGALNSASLDGKLFSPKKEFSGIYNGSSVTMSGEFLDGYYAIQEGDINMRINIDPLVDLRLIGDFKVDGTFDLKAEVNKLDVGFVNYVFSQPIVQFTPGHFLYGDLFISPNQEAFTLRGNMSSDYAEIEVFWLPNQKVLLHDINFLVWDNDFENVMCNATVLNLETFERTPIDVRFGITFDDSFAYEAWDLDVFIPEEHLVDFRLAMTSSNIDIVGKANGHLNIVGPGVDVDIYGDVKAQDTTLSLGMNPLPYWYNPTADTDISLDVYMKNNIQFVFPLGANPILRTNIADGSYVHFQLDNDGIKADGEIPLRSGEIFYFQKYFYITEGNIELREGATGLDPVINLRARLRDFDANGEKVDIYLVLREATLNNISPTLESSPSKDLNEIMSILGNSILPTSATQSTSGVETVASLAAAGVDILQKFGFFGLGEGGIDNSIRQSLALDTFSIHSNIIANLLTDTVSLAGFSTSSPFSPMARYLDGTTLFLGKYLMPNIYLQALVHLSADRGNNKNGFAFIADDLVLDTEVSLEWTNPLLTVNYFTNPSNFSLYEFIDNFGFSFTKRILF